VRNFINLHECVENISKAYDITTCPITGNVFVIGLADGHIIIVVFNHRLQFMSTILTCIQSGYHPYISVTRTGDLLITHYGSEVLTDTRLPGYLQGEHAIDV
jgi:hypothetical protein